MGPEKEPDGPADHTPVLYNQILSALEPRPGGRYLDGTVGGGGHALGLLEKSAPDGLLLGLDRDPKALEVAGKRLTPYEGRFELKQASYAEMAEQAGRLGWTEVNGVLLDLGLSSMQLEDAERGFSFQREGPLDMRFGPGIERTAADLLNHLDERELADLLATYGEERRAGRIARAIVERRPLKTTLELAQIVRQALGGRGGRIHPATRTFQALRIAVNDELETLKLGLEAALSLMAGGGRLAVISFHSLEDRIVKQFIRRESEDCVCPPEQPVCTCEHEATLRPLFKKPLRPSEEEILANPRSRSARLRVAERLSLA